MGFTKRMKSLIKNEKLPRPYSKNRILLKTLCVEKELTLTETEKNIEKIFKLIGKLLVTAFCIAVIYVSFSL